MLAPAFHTHTTDVPVVKTNATSGTGIPELYQEIEQLLQLHSGNEKRFWLLAERAYHLIRQQRMKTIDKARLKSAIEKEVEKGGFNLYGFVKQFDPCP